MQFNVELAVLNKDTVSNQ